MDKTMNAVKVLENIDRAIAELTARTNNGYTVPMDWERFCHKGYDSYKGWCFKMDAVYSELSIFDWWNDTLSLSQLKQMKKFVETAISLGFTGYVCFKVGAKHCSHGMWAYKNESTDGYSPDGDTLFHSFRAGDNYYDMELDGVWMHKKYATEDNDCPDFTLKQIKAELANA